MPGKVTMENVERTFSSVEITEGQQKLIADTTNSFISTARKVIANVPDCAHRSAALRSLLEAKMMCTDAIAKGGEV